ncbi:MAG: mechanosensitive ion channel domain-containing protein, partial [Tistlia sp.]
MRARLASVGKGKWQNTGGEKSKFGLTASQILDVVDTLRHEDALESLQLVHFHLGSQIANIRDIQRGLRECARFYQNLMQLGAPIDTVDVGGGLGIDYEGTRSRSFCSANYSMREYARNVVSAFSHLCQEAELPQPHLISESGRAFVGQVVKILLVIGGSLVVWEVTSSTIESYLRGRPGGRSARTTTLLKLFQTALRVILAVLVVLIVLSEVGLDIAPLLAGAGVIGLAVGFGAQTLVKDVITGIFMLMENTIAVGDVVEIGGHTGVVEQVSIRTAHLRDLEGRVHVVPFSDVTSVINYGRGFAYALIDMGVSYRENLDEVVAVLKEAAEELRQEEQFKGVILGELEVLGLDAFGASEIVVRVRLKTTPLMQWSVKRAFNAHIKKAFDAKGIEIPFPHRTIYFGVDKDGSAPPMHLVQEPSPAAALEGGEAEDADDAGNDAGNDG